MKKFVPFKYILVMIALFLIIPLLIIFLLLSLIGKNDTTIGLSMFFGFLIIIGPLAYYKNLENASIIIKDNSLTNNINDGTLNFGWTEDIKNIKEMKIVDKMTIQKYYKNCRSKNSILFNFGNYKFKYISISLFTRNQVKKILKYINDIMINY